MDAQRARGKTEPARDGGAAPRNPRQDTFGRGPAVSWAGYAVGPAFFAFAAWFLWGAAPTVPATPGGAGFPADRLNTGPRRAIIGDPPRIVVNNFARVCTDCHAIFDVNAKPEGDRLQHKHVVLEHGINDQCRNCHDYGNMNRLVLYNGEPVAYADVPHLCQKCHGPVYMDWERGIHGRVNDFWSAAQGAPRKLKCIECHDPHQPRRPAMEPLAPLAGPHTLRMKPPGAQGGHSAELAEGDPLRRALLPHPTASQPAEATTGGHAPEGREGGGP